MIRIRVIRIDGSQMQVVVYICYDAAMHHGLAPTRLPCIAHKVHYRHTAADTSQANDIEERMQAGCPVRM